ncbi:MAG: hypothetical protein HY901_16585 [Deltaproteobacteria bacterium]|nr:hypothetical protein [Deltaproteobacteria bacterium]
MDARFKFGPCLALAVASLLTAVTAYGAERRHLPRLAVLDLKVTGSVDLKSVAALSPVIVSEAAQYPVRVFAGSDLQALIGLEKQKELLGCSDSSCLAQVGGALGVGYLLVPEIGEIGGRWLLTTTLLDVARATALARATKQAATAGDLVDLVPAALAETFNASPLAKTVTAPSAPAAQARAQAPAPSTSPARVAGFALLGVGGAALVGGVVAGVLAEQEHSSAKDAPPTSEEALSTTKASIDAKLWVADGLFVAAAVAAGAGLVLVLTAPSPTAPSATPETISTSVTLAPVAGGGALVFSGGF